MRLVWLSDIHLNFIDETEVGKFFAAIKSSSPDVVLVGGDIGEAKDCFVHLRSLEKHLGLPIYFVLGNHDFYGGSIAGGRAKARELSRASERLSWLPETGVVRLSPSTGLIGHDSWADGRLGDYRHSEVMLTDHLAIQELRCFREERLSVMRKLADEAADYFRTTIPGALGSLRHLFILTHVPPFREACWHEGRISNDDYLPHFACKAAGEALVAFMEAHPDCRMTVLCGHTHSGGEVQILPNLLVLAAEARYGHPQIQRIFEIE